MIIDHQLEDNVRQTDAVCHLLLSFRNKAADGMSSSKLRNEQLQNVDSAGPVTSPVGILDRLRLKVDHVEKAEAASLPKKHR